MTRRDALRSLLGVSVLAFMPNTVKRLCENHATLSEKTLEAALIAIRNKLDGMPLHRDIVAVRTTWIGNRTHVEFIDRKDFYQELPS